MAKVRALLDDTEEEKIKIAMRHLISKQLAEHGIDKKQLQIRESAVRAIVRKYTREAGVRSLERNIAKICRKASPCAAPISSTTQPPGFTACL